LLKNEEKYRGIMAIFMKNFEPSLITDKSKLLLSLGFYRGEAKNKR
jgi:hypothetical protein